MRTSTFSIKEFNFENKQKNTGRIACYVSNKLNYEQRNNLEIEACHDLGQSSIKNINVFNL